jgi:hypothetical protein
MPNVPPAKSDSRSGPVLTDFLSGFSGLNGVSAAAVPAAADVSRGGTVNGYSVEGYEIRSLSNAIAAEVDRVGEELWRLSGSEVTSADLGHDVGATYVAVVHGTLAESLAAFQSAGQRLSRQLMSTLARVESVDEDARAAFDKLGDELG